MFRRSLSIAIRFVGVIAAGLAVLVVFAAVRLSYGPVSLEFLTPHIARGLTSDDGSFKVAIGDTVLSWEGWDHVLDIYLSEVRVTDRDGREQAYVPEIAIGLSLRALVLEGRLAPTRLALDEPRLMVIRRADGGFAFGDSFAPAGAPVGAEQTPPATDAESSRIGSTLTARVIGALTGSPDYRGPLEYLNTLSLINAEFVYDDRRAGVFISAPGSDIVLTRGVRGLGGSARLNIVAGDRSATINLAGGYNAVDRAMDLEARFGGVTPSDFAGLAPAMAPMGAARFPIQGRVHTRFTLDGALSDVVAEIEAGAGRIETAEFFDVPVNLRSAVLKARATDGLSRLLIEDFSADFNGPRIALSGTAARGDGAVSARLEAGARDVTTADLKRLWPKGVAPGARAWVLENVDNGGVRALQLAAELDARQDAAGRPTDVSLRKLEGGFDFSGLDIHYLRPLPPVTGVAGEAKLGPTAIDFTTAAGRLGALAVSEGKFRTHALDTGIELLDLDLVAAGPVADVVRLLEHPRLNLIKDLGIASGSIKGDGATRLALKFPLRKDLTFDHMHVAAASTLRGVALPGIALGNDLTEGDMTLRLDKRGMEVTGAAKLGGAPVSLTWTENFISGGAFISRYAVKGVADDATRAKFGLDFLAPYVMGPVGADLLILKLDRRRMSLAATLDLKDAKLAFEEIGYARAAGVAGIAQVALAIEDDKVKRIERLAIRTGDLRAMGSVALGPDGKSIAGFEFQELAFGENDYSVRGTYGADDALALNIAGKKADIRFFLQQKNGGRPKRPLDITAELAEVRAAPNATIAEVKGRLVRDRIDWLSMEVAGKVGKGTPLTMRIAPEGGQRRLKIASADAGAALKAFDITDNMIGGTLNIEGTYDDGKPKRPLTGHFGVRNYNMVQAPFLTKLLAVASLTGILDMLTGKGIAFARADIPFVKTGDDLELKDGRAHGNSVGFTFSGRLDLDKDTMDVTGTVVPAYALNSVFADVPLLGPIFVPEKGSGLFAATYSMKGPIADPDVTVNPLATLTPGFLRGLFNIFDAPEKGKEPAKAKEPATAPVQPPPPAPTPAP